MKKENLKIQIRPIINKFGKVPPPKMPEYRVKVRMTGEMTGRRLGKVISAINKIFKTK